MVFGAGYAGGTDTNLGNYVYVLDFEPSPETFADPITGTTAPQFDGGNVIKIVTVTPDATSDIPNGVTAHMSVVTPDGAPVPVGKESLAYYGGIAYFPDLQGQVWKLDLSKTSLEEDDTTMYSINKMFSSEGTLANDRFGYNQMASTLVRSTDPEGTHLFQYYGTGDQAHIQTRYPSIKNRLYGVKDLDWPDTGLTLTGSSKTISSSGVLNIDSGSCDITNVPGWYTHVKNQATLDDPPLGDGADNMKVIGRAIVANKDVYFTIYRPEDKECPAYGSGETIKLKEGCGGGVETIAIGAGLTTAPVMDNKGNIYVGVSNLATGETLEGKGEEGDLEGFSGRDNILKIGSSDVSSSSSEPGIKIKSWREITGEY
jgi:type IV pilus assembly protein PilY1